MKKYLGIAGIGLLTLLLTGCGGEIKKTMVCTMDDNESIENASIQSELLIKYVGDEMTEIKENVYLTLSDFYTVDMIENIKDNLELQYEQKKLNLKSWKVEVDGQKISVLTEKDIEELEDLDIDSESSYEDAKEVLIDRGYTCK